MREIYQNRWVTTCPKKIIRFSEMENGELDIEGEVFHKEHYPAVKSNGGIKYINFIKDGWKLEHYRLFNPLIYTSAFGGDEIFECLSLLVETLLKVGDYKGDFAVITDAANSGKVKAVTDRFEFQGEVRIVEISGCHNVMDFCLSRFRFTDDDFFRDRQPLVYLDVDILINTSIEPVLSEMVFSSSIQVPPEGVLNEGHPESDGHWYGWRLMAEAGMEFDPWQRAFSAGLIGYGSSDLAYDYAPIIMEISEGYKKYSEQKRGFIGYDQCLANYVFLKSQVLSFDGLGQAITLYRINLQNISGFPSQKLGFIHFLGVDYPDKLKSMHLYKRDVLFL